MPTLSWAWHPSHPKSVLRRSAVLGLVLAFLGSGLRSSGASAQQAPSADSPSETAISGPRDLLRRYGIWESHIRQLVDGQPIHGDETETLLRVIPRIRNFRRVDVERWAHQLQDPSDLAADSADSRGEIFRLDGRVTRVEVLSQPADVRDRFGLVQVYRYEFLLAGGQPAVVFAEKVPRPWHDGGPIDARGAALGMFLKLAGGVADRPTPVFAAGHVAWYPSTSLGDLDMDAGLLDEIDDGTPITARQRECFYQMLAAVGRAEPGQLLRQADGLLADAPDDVRHADGRQHSVVPLFNDPSRQRGRLVALSGTARQVQRILVSDPEVVARFGFDHYYQMSILTDDSQGNPLTFCVRRLPPAMPTGSDPTYAERVRVAGFFLKRWAYRVEDPEATLDTRVAADSRRQLSPLLIGREPVWFPEPAPRRSTLAGTIAGVLFALAVLGLWLGWWRHAQREKRFRARARESARR